MTNTCKAYNQLEEVEKLLVKAQIVIDDVYRHHLDELPNLAITSSRVNGAKESLKESIERAVEKGI